MAPGRSADHSPRRPGCFLDWFRARSRLSTSDTGQIPPRPTAPVSRWAVVRGVHFAIVPPGQAKYVTCVSGAILDVIVISGSARPAMEAERQCAWVIQVGVPCFCRPGWDMPSSPLTMRRQLLFEVTPSRSDGPETAGGSFAGQQGCGSRLAGQATPGQVRRPVAALVGARKTGARPTDRFAGQRERRQPIRRSGRDPGPDHTPTPGQIPESRAGAPPKSSLSIPTAPRPWLPGHPGSARPRPPTIRRSRDPSERQRPAQPGGR